MSGQYHVELRPRSLRYYTMESRHKTLRNVLLYPRKRKCAAQNEISALGQKATYRGAGLMSALHPIADMCSALADVCKCQMTDYGS